VSQNDFLDPQIQEAKARHRYELLLKANVQGIGLGTKRVNGADTGIPCIIVYVYPKFPPHALDARDVIPTAVGDALTDIVEMRPAQARVRSASSVREPERTKRWRPAPGGVSVGHYQLKGAGTLGDWIRDEKTGEPLLVSCWHVLTNYGRGHRGDPILQPALVDRGTVEDDTIAYLDKWVDVKMLGGSLGEAKSNLKALLDRGKLPPVNYVDVAFAKAVSKEVVSYETLGLGERKGIGRSQLGDRVVGSGRTTGVTQGRVSAVGVDIFVGYPTGVALFLDQDVISREIYESRLHFHRPATDFIQVLPRPGQHVDGKSASSDHSFRS